MYIYKLFLDFISKYPLTIFLYTFFTILTFPLESVLIPQIYSSFFSTIKTNSKPDVFIYFFALIAAVLIVVNISTYITACIEAQMIPEWTGFIMDWIFQNILELYENKMTDIEMGKLIVEISIIPKTVRDLVSEVVNWIFPRAITILIINVYFFYLHWMLGGISVLLLVVFVLMNMFIYKRCAHLAKIDYTMFQDKMQDTQNLLSNSHTIYSMGNVEKEVEEYTKNTRFFTDNYKDKLSCMNTGNLTMSFSVCVTMLALNSMATYLFFKKKISYTELIAIFMTVIYYVPNISVIIGTMPEMIQRYSVLSVVDELVQSLYENYTKRRDPVNEKAEKTIASGEIDIQHLTFGYTPDTPIFKDWSLKIKDKEKIALLGQSGRGKSTLVKLIMGYYPVPVGCIFIDGRDIHEYNLNHLRKQITYVNQNTKLFHTSLYKNICYGNTASKEEVEKVIQDMKIGKVFQNLPKGLDTDVGVDGNKLSGGQRQMVHIIRAVLKRNRIVILDEPTSAMDKDTKVYVLRAIEELAKHSTLLVITHDETITRIVDRVVRI